MRAHAFIKRDLQDFVKLSPQVRFILLFQLIILFVLSILVGVLFSPHFKPIVRDQSLILDIVSTRA